MRVVVQRVNHASVRSEAHGEASIHKGLMILLGIEPDDVPEDIEWLTGKLLRLRIFDIARKRRTGYDFDGLEG